MTLICPHVLIPGPLRPTIEGAVCTLTHIIQRLWRCRSDSERFRLEAGILPGFVRMSVGIEDVDDLWSDIEQALEASQS